MKVLKRYEQHIQRQVQADQAAGGSGLFTIQAHGFMWLLPLTIGTAVGNYLMASTLGRLLFDAPFMLVTIIGMTVATVAGVRAKR